MARIREQYTVPAQSKERVREVICDVCGRGRGQSDYPRGCVDWKDGGYQVDEVTVTHKVGESYPEGEFTRLYYFDLCSSCWTTKLVPFLQSLGAAEQEWDGDEPL